MSEAKRLKTLDDENTKLKRLLGPMLIPIAAIDRWSLGFVSDQLTGGRRFRVLTVVDNCTRECLALVADTSLSGLRLPVSLTGLSRSAASRR